MSTPKVLTSEGLTEYEKGWVCGMFDGEGSVVSTKAGLSINTQHIPTLEQMQKLFGGGIALNNRAGVKSSATQTVVQKADSYQWSLYGGAEAFDVAIEILAEGCREKWSQLQLLKFVRSLPNGDPRKKIAFRLIRKLKKKPIVSTPEEYQCESSLPTSKVMASCSPSVKQTGAGAHASIAFGASE